MVVVLACSTFSGVAASCSSSCASTSSTPSYSRAIVCIPRWRCRKSRCSGVCWSGTREVGSKELMARVVATEVAANRETGSFLDARSGEDILYLIQKGAESGKLTENIATGMKILYHNYRNAVLKSKNPLANDVILSNMSLALDRILFEVEDPFTFPPHHRAVREPFDYYAFGQNYIRPLIDFRTSYIGNISIFQEVEEKLQKGHNVIFVSNHQTEADPAVIALLLETTNPFLAEKLTYVAGDRVVTDPFCKPFSMGRNLICVYSKNHLYDIPELADMKKKANTRSLKAMALLLRGGGQLIWIAPSGGRDRPDSLTGKLHPASFDASSVDNIRRLADHSTVEGHIYPLSLLCYDIMPPPHQVEKEIGEQRCVSFHGVGLSIGPEVKFDKIASTSETAEEAKNIFSQALYSSVSEQYDVLKSAIYRHDGLNASNSSVSLSQSWK